MHNKNIFQIGETAQVIRENIKVTGEMVTIFSFDLELPISYVVIYKEKKYCLLQSEIAKILN